MSHSYGLFLSELDKNTREIYQLFVDTGESKGIEDCEQTKQLCRLMCDLFTGSFELGVNLFSIIQFIPEIKLKEYRNPDMSIVVKKLINNKHLSKVLNYIKDNKELLFRKRMIDTNSIFFSTEHVGILVAHVQGLEVLDIQYKMETKKKKKKKKRRKKVKKKKRKTVIHPLPGTAATTGPPKKRLPSLPKALPGLNLPSQVEVVSPKAPVKPKSALPIRPPPKPVRPLPSLDPQKNKEEKLVVNIEEEKEKKKQKEEELRRKQLEEEFKELENKKREEEELKQKLFEEEEERRKKLQEQVEAEKLRKKKLLAEEEQKQKQQNRKSLKQHQHQQQQEEKLPKQEEEEEHEGEGEDTPVLLSFENSMITPSEILPSYEEEQEQEDNFIDSMIRSSHSLISASPTRSIDRLIKLEAPNPRVSLAFPKSPISTPSNSVNIIIQEEEQEEEEEEYYTTSEEEEEFSESSEEEEEFEKTFKNLEIREKSESGKSDVVYHVPARKSIQGSWVVLDENEEIVHASFTTVCDEYNNQPRKRQLLCAMTTKEIFTYLVLPNNSLEILTHIDLDKTYFKKEYSLDEEEEEEEKKKKRRGRSQNRVKFGGWLKAPGKIGFLTQQNDIVNISAPVDGNNNQEPGKIIGEIRNLEQRVLNIVFLENYFVVVKQLSTLVVHTDWGLEDDLEDFKRLKAYLTHENKEGVIASCPATSGLAILGLAVGETRVCRVICDNQVHKCKIKHRLKAHRSGIKCMKFSQDGSLLVTASEKGAVFRIWSTQTGELVKEIRRSYFWNAQIYDLCVSKNRDLIGCVSDNGYVEVFSLDSRWFYISHQVSEGRRVFGGCGSDNRGICEFSHARNHIMHFVGVNGLHHKIELDIPSKRVAGEKVNYIFDETPQSRLRKKKELVFPFVDRVIRDLYREEMQNWASMGWYEDQIKNEVFDVLFEAQQQEKKKNISEEKIIMTSEEEMGKEQGKMMMLHQKVEEMIVDKEKLLRKGLDRLLEQDVKKFMASSRKCVEEALNPVFKRRMSVNQVIIRKAIEKVIKEKAFHNFQVINPEKNVKFITKQVFEK